MTSKNPIRMIDKELDIEIMREKKALEEQMKNILKKKRVKVSYIIASKMVAQKKRLWGLP